jgi:hypothetical protein
MYGGTFATRKTIYIALGILSMVENQRVLHEG